MNKPLIKASIAAAALGLGLGVDAFAQNTAPSAAQPATSTTPDPAIRAKPSTKDPNANASKPMANGSGLARDDVKFIETTAMHGMAEVELGKLAQKQAESQAVKDFAARMVKDHSKANDELKPIAQAKNVALPAEPDKQHRQDMEKLMKKTGADFDKAYMDHMVKDHKKDVKEFQKKAKSSKDADVQAFASKTLPTLEEHLRMAQETHDAVKGARKKG